MNGELIALFASVFLAVAIIFVMVTSRYVTPILKTRPPVGSILKLIKENETFDIYDDISEEDRRVCAHFVEYVIYDPLRKVKTFLYRDGFSGSVTCTGDLSWMNRWERNRVMSLIESIFHTKRKNCRIARKIKDEERDERRRKEAMEFYANNPEVKD